METENTSAPEGGSPTIEETTVPISEATDQELDAFLEQDSEVDQSAEPQEVAPEEEETTTAAADEEEAPEEDAQDEPKRETSTTEVADRQAQLEAENQKLRAQMEAQRLFIERRSTEYGELRKQNQHYIAQLNEGLEDILVENPVEGHRRLLQIQKLEEQNEQIDKTNLTMVQKFQAQKVVLDHLKPDEWDLEGMSKALEADKIDPNYVQAFRRDPLGVARPETIIQLARRVKAESLLSRLVTHTKTLMKEKESLEKRLKSAPTDIARRIDEIGKRPPQVMSKAGKTTKARPVDARAEDISNWSNEQIEEFLQSK